MRFSLLWIALLVLARGSATTGEVVQVKWPTANAAQPLYLQKPASDLLPAFRLAIETLPESSIVALALTQPALLGLTAEQAKRLQPLVGERYRLISKSDEYAPAPSSLPYCFSALKATNGLASVYLPEKITTNTPAVLFLHGYGGSFLWYQHYLSENFPDHIIICPAYGISAATVPQAYVSESVTAVSKRAGFQITAPTIVGLSAGGFGACRLYVGAPRFYSQMICMGAYPTDDIISRFEKHSRPRFLSGAREPFVSSGDFQKRTDSVRRACPQVESVILPAADHFFLLTHPKETLEHLRRWLSKP